MVDFRHKIFTYRNGSIRVHTPPTGLRVLKARNQGIQRDLNQEPPYIAKFETVDGVLKVRVTAAGANWMIDIGAPEIALLRRINPPSDGYSTEDKLQYLAKVEAGYPYQIISSTHWQWPYIVMASRINYPDQVNILQVKRTVLEWSVISWLPKMPSYETFNGIPLTPQNFPWWFECLYSGDGLTPKGTIWIPAFGPWGFPHSQPADADIDAVVVPTEYFI